MSDEAKIAISVEGQQAVLDAFAAISEAAKSAGEALKKTGEDTAKLEKPISKVGEAWKDFGKSLKSEIASSIKTTVSDTARAISVLNTLSFAQAIQKNNEYRMSVDKMSVAYGRSASDISKSVRQVSNSLGVSDQEIIGYADAISKYTGSFDQATGLAEALKKEATASNVDPNTLLPGIISQALKGSVKAGKDYLEINDKIRSSAKAQGVSAVGVREQYEALTGPMSNLAAGQKSLPGLVAYAAKGRSPEKAGAILSGIAAYVQDSQRLLKSRTGHDQIDEFGQVKDLSASIGDIRKMWEGAGYKGKNLQTALQGVFGPETGSFIYNFDKNQVGKQADAVKADEANAKFQQTDSQRLAAQKAAQEKLMMGAADKTRGLQNWFAGLSPGAAMAIGTFGAPIGSAILNAGITKLAGAGLAKAGLGVGAGAAGALGTAALWMGGAAAAGAAGYGVGTLLTDTLPKALGAKQGLGEWIGNSLATGATDIDQGPMVIPLKNQKQVEQSQQNLQQLTDAVSKGAEKGISNIRIEIVAPPDIPLKAIVNNKVQ